MRPLLIIVGCEESQEVCKAFRARGHIAYSCDLKECSGGHPEWHLNMDIFQALSGGRLLTQYGNEIEIEKWDIGIFFPDCTYLTITANKWLKDQPERKSGKLVGAARRAAQQQAIEFFKRLTRCGLPKWAIENPVGVMSKEYRAPNQIIHPYYFGHSESKKTCLWLSGLPRLNGKLERADLKFEPEMMMLKSGKRMPMWYAKPKHTDERQVMRSKTFPEIAAAMARSWSPDLTLIPSAT